MNRFFSKFIGSRDFYKKVLIIVVPIILQNLVTNFVNLLDNIMVGRTGTDQMNAVSVVNQLWFVINLCLWGAVSGAGIFTAQFFGKCDNKGVRDTFRAKLILVGVVAVGGTLLLLLQGPALISLFLHETDGIGNAEQTLEYALSYLHITLYSMIPLALEFAYSNTLRDVGQTRIPMIAGITAVFVNLILNYILIFGHFGLPAMGVKGAAYATVTARFVEAIINMAWCHSHKKDYPFIQGLYSSLSIPPALLKKIIIQGLPLALNECLWSLGLTALNQNYSLRGLSVIAALNISTTIANMFNVFYFAIGESISIIAGQQLGAGRKEEAMDTARKMLALSFTVSLVFVFIMSALRNVFPAIYNTEQEVKELAGKFILITSCFIPVMALVHGSYFTIRCGGKTFITFLFDSVFVWVFSVSSSFLLSRFTDLNIVYVVLIVQSMDLIKLTLGLTLVKKGIWLNNIVE